MKTLLFLILLASLNTHAAEFTLFTYGKPSKFADTSIAQLISELAQKEGGELQILNSKSSTGFFMGGRYILPSENSIPDATELDRDFRNSQRDFSPSTLIENSRGLLFFSPQLPKELSDKIFAQAKVSTSRSWNDLSLGKAKSGLLNQFHHEAVLVSRQKWRRDRHWHSIHFKRLEIIYAGKKYTVFEVPKEFGSAYRVFTLLKEKLKKARKPLIVGTGNISLQTLKNTQEWFTNYSRLGENFHVVGIRDLLFLAQQQRENYERLFPKMFFTSVNVFKTVDGKEKPFVPQHLIVERDGLKIGIVGITDPLAQKVIEQNTVLNDALKSITIKDPLPILIKDVLPQIRQKVDLVILLSDIRSEKFGEINDQLRDIDIVVSKGHKVFTGEKESSVKLTSFQNREPSFPILQLKTSKINFNSATISIKKDTLSANINETILDQSIPYKDSIEGTLTGHVSTSNQTETVLPALQEVFPQKKYESLSRDQFGWIAGEMLRRSLDAEIGTFNIQDQTTNISGELSSAAIRGSVRRSELLTSFYLPGHALLKLLESLPQLSEPYRLAIAGVKDGMVNGVPINPSEVYLVASSTAVSENIENYPGLELTLYQNNRFIKNDHLYRADDNGVRYELAEIIIEKLKENWERLDPLSKEQQIEAYQNLYNGNSSQKETYWVHEFKDIRLEYSKLNTQENDAFNDITDSQIQSSDQETIGGKLNYSAFYRTSKYILESGLRSKFSKVDITQEDGSVVKNVLEDDWVLFTEIGFPVFKIKGSELWATKMGPFFEFAYDSEFESDVDQPLEKVYRGTLGWKFFEGQYLKSTTLGGFGEFQRTAGRVKDVSGVEVKFEWVMPALNDRLQWRSEGQYKYFFDTDKDSSNDLQSRFIWDNYLDFKVIGKISVGPYFKYLSFSGKTFDEKGTQTTIGFSLNYSGHWKPRYQRHPM